MIQVLARAFAVFDLLRERGEMGLGEIAAATGLQKTTLHNILKTLEGLGAVRRAEGGRYALGPKLAYLGEPQVRGDVLREAACRAADALAARVREDVTVSVLRGADRFVIAHASGPQAIVVRPDRAYGESPYSVTTGRVLLAHLSEDELSGVTARRGPPSPEEWPGAQTAEALRAALAEIRAAGFAYRLGENGQVRTLARPVFGPDGRVWAAVGVTMPEIRFASRAGEIEAGLNDAAAAMTTELSRALPRP